jgi:hypothetical protein
MADVQTRPRYDCDGPKQGQPGSGASTRNRPRGRRTHSQDEPVSLKLVDANVLLYAVNQDAPFHERSRQFLDGALSGSDTVAFAWIALLAFDRLTTKAALFPNPLTVDEALGRVDAG